MKCRLVTLAQLVAAFTFLVPLCQTAKPDALYVSYLAPGVQTPAGITSNYETFNSLSYNGVSLNTNFNGSPITGTYTGSFSLISANTYGGAGGSGLYPQTTNATGYSLALSASVNYFGLWFSALDAGNNLAFYNNNVLVYDFTPAAFINLVGACPASPFCGNPNAATAGDNGEQFAYLNFYDPTSTFNKIVFTESISGNGFESDNQAVANLSAPPLGTVITGTPEPSSFMLFATGCIGAVALVLIKRAEAKLN